MCSPPSRMNSSEEGTHFWNQVDALNVEVRKLFGAENEEELVLTAQQLSDKRREVLAAIENISLEVTRSVAQGEAPCLSYTRRDAWENVMFVEGLGLQMIDDGSQTHVKFDSIVSVNKFALTVKILSMVYKLVTTDTYCTKRDIYYQDPTLFGSQATVDGVIDNVACMLQFPRWRLHVLATSKGCIAGDLRYTESDGNAVDCSRTSSGILVPSHVTGVHDIESSAKFILVVEKDASFQKLLDDNFCQKLFPCILVTGRGVPDVNTRLMLRKLHVALRVPVFALVDGDPHGIEIMAVYKFGSKSLSFEAANLTVPSLKWMGIWPSDLARFQLPPETLLPLTATDRQKAQQMLRRTYLCSQPHWRTELEELLRVEVKAEIEALQAIAPGFLTDVYLTNKLRFGGWV